MVFMRGFCDCEAAIPIWQISRGGPRRICPLRARDLHVLPSLSRKSLFKTRSEIGAGTGFPL
jgi:hypothetical protein